MNQNNNKHIAPNEPDAGGRIALWVSLSAAAAAALLVLAVAFYADYDSKEPAVQPEPAVSAAAAPSVIPTSEAQAASIAADTSDLQSQGMTAPADVPEAGEAETSASAAVPAAPPAAETASAAASAPAPEAKAAEPSPAEAILAAENAANAETRVLAENDAVLFYFAKGKSDMPANTLEALKGTVEGVKGGKKAVITSYADAESNATLTKERAFAVRSVLLAAGVPGGSIEIKEPEAGGGNGRLVRVVLQ